MVKLSLKPKTVAPECSGMCLDTIWHPDMDWILLSKILFWLPVESVQCELFKGLTLTFIHYKMIHCPHSSFRPNTTLFSFLHSVLSPWNSVESSLGSRAKTATLSLLHQAGVKSANRLLWPNVIKLQSGSGQFAVCQFCLSCVSRIATELQLSILLLKEISLQSGLDWKNHVE